MEQMLWSVFEQSGRIDSYLLYKTLTDCQREEDEEAINEDDACQGSDTALL
ncbi:MAG: YqzL family protein [Clostridiales bacterium]|nr:YqzL family protein [Clostridiales bacterium]